MYTGGVVDVPRLRELRERYPLTQDELAARVGITRAALSRIEAGKAEPRPSTIRKLAASLGVTPADLMAPRPAP